MATKNVNAEAVQAEETEKKEAVNILDLLLGSDVGEIKLPTKEVEITRLSQVYGAPFILTIKAITPAKFEEIQDMSIDVKGKDADIDITQLQLFTVIEGVGRAGTHIITHDIKSTVNKSSDLNVAQALSTGGSSGAITMDIAVKDEVESPHYEGVGVGMAFTKIITHDINSKATNSGNTTVASPVNTASIINSTK